MAPLVVENPHLDRVIELGPNERLTDLARRLRALRPTHGLDLHGSLRSAALRLLVPCQWSGYSKRKLARTALIAAKINMYGKHVPVPERYFEAARALDVHPDGRAPEFFLAPAAREGMARWLSERGLDRQPVAALAPAAAHATKRWPIRPWTALAEQPRKLGYRLVAVGGTDDRELAGPVGPDGHNAAGE